MISIQGILSLLKICVVLGLGAATAYVLIAALSFVLLAPFFIVIGVFSVSMGLLTTVLCLCQEILADLGKYVLRLLRIDKEYRRNSYSRSGSQSDTSQTYTSHILGGQAFDAYQVLEVSRCANAKEIRSAYLRQMSQYHPDKVSHLGTELRVFAEEKAKTIQQAYAALSRHQTN